MKAAIFDEVGKPLRLTELPKPIPSPTEVLIRVQACGICHAEVNQLRGHFPFARYPCVPGHEIAGIVIARGDDVSWPDVGSRVGVPFLYSSCRFCDYCVKGDQILCSDIAVTGVNVDGGYAEYMVVPATNVVLIPQNMDMTSVAPIMCAGVTVYNGLIRSGFQYGDRVAVIGTGGLGQLAVQYASSMGATVAAVSRGRKSETVVRSQGASHYITTSYNRRRNDLAQELQRWGGANVILNTAPSSETATLAAGGLAPDGTLVLLGHGPDPVTVSPLLLVMNRASVMGCPPGSPQDLRDALRFAADHNIVPNVTPVELKDAQHVLNCMDAGTQNGRAVIKFSQNFTKSF